MARTNDPVDRLYELPPGEFTSARDHLAAELREQGDRDAAARVKELRRPTVSAWALNQLVRAHRREVQELLQVGEDVRAAASGGGAEHIRELTGRRRRVVDRLLDRAKDLLAEAGHATSRSTMDKVGDTLMAATLDEEAADAVRTGRLGRELVPPTGFEALSGAVPATAEKESTLHRQARERAKRAHQDAEAAEEAAEKADREAHRLEQEAERIRQEARRARRRASRAAERARELREKAREAGRAR